MERRRGHTDTNPNDTLVHQAINPIKPPPSLLPNGGWALDLSSHQVLNRYMKTKGIGADISLVHFLPHSISLGPAPSIRAPYRVEHKVGMEVYLHPEHP
jgi:hypothetical protein